MAKKKTTEAKITAEKATPQGEILLRLNIQETVTYEIEKEITSEQLAEIEQLNEGYSGEDLAQELLDRFVDKTTDITGGIDQEVNTLQYKLPGSEVWEDIDEPEPCEDLGDGDDAGDEDDDGEEE
jgi:hypothetical protein